MLVSKEEFIRQQQERSKLVGKTIQIAHHASKKTLIATVTKQDENSITLEGLGIPKEFRLYYGSYHILEFFN